MCDSVNANQILAYVSEHPRREQVFPGWSREQVLMCTLEHMRDDTILVITKPDRIVGILMYEDHNPGEIFVDAVLTSMPGVLAMFIGVWKQRCPERQIVAHRRHQRIAYTDRALTRHMHQEFLRIERSTPASVNYATA